VFHPSADIHPTATIGADTRVWHHAQVGAEARLGAACIVGSNVYIDRGVVIGSRVKIQTGAQLYRGTTIEDGVFVGPLVCVTNDTYPRAITPDGRLKTDADWQMGSTVIRAGAALGAGAIILAGITIGRFAMVAAGAVVTRDVPDHGLVLGTPARLVGYACACGHPLREAITKEVARWRCSSCGSRYVRLATEGLSAADEAPSPREEGAVLAGGRP
jgi:UDP-2-acetamido-3-amino-2,3-dideoxy-glucuronate N-acetyltransferase